MARYFDWDAKRDQLVDAVVDDLMSGEAEDESNNFSPLMPKNFSEFLQEMSADARDQILELMVEESDCIASERQRVLSLIGLKLVILNRDYWENLARQRAEREVPTAREMDECAREDAAEHLYQLERDERICA